MVAHDRGAIEAEDDVEAFLWIGPVADDVTETHVVRAALFGCVLQDGLEPLEIRVDVTQDRVAKVCSFRGHDSILGNTRLSFGIFN